MSKPHETLRAILSVAGWPDDRSSDVTFTGGTDPVLPTTFRIGVAGSATVAAKGAGGMVRSKAEWAVHPQGKAVAALPLMEIVRIGDSRPEALPSGKRPLSGIRVLDLTRVLAGPTCGRTLAEHGADVMKITAAHLPVIEYQEYDTGHGKLSTHLDLRQVKDLDILRGLVREADVFSQGYRPGSLG